MASGLSNNPGDGSTGRNYITEEGKKIMSFQIENHTLSLRSQKQKLAIRYIDIYSKHLPAYICNRGPCKDVKGR